MLCMISYENIDRQQVDRKEFILILFRLFNCVLLGIMRLIICTSIVLVSQSCHNKLPQIRWFKATDIYSLTVLEASPKSSCQQGPAPSEASMEEAFLASCSLWWLLAILDILWLVAVLLVSASVFPRFPLCLSVSESRFLP